MRLSAVGEFGLIDLIKKNTINDYSTVQCGIGDDAAVLKPTGNMLQLATTDMLVQDVHFSLATIEPWQLGYKALAVNISDIAAMGGIPRHALISVALPRTASVAFVQQLYAGIKAIASKYAINIVGGDTVSSPEGIVINVTVLGEAEQDRVVYRSGAREGDWLVVSGTLGDSAGGLQILRDQLEFDGGEPLIQAHLLPEPQVKVGRLCAHYQVHALNDISDGLASELNEICTASGCGAVIYQNKLPLSRELRTLAAFTGQPAADYALYGGEDYQLLLAARPETVQGMIKDNPEVKLTVVGETAAKENGVVFVDEQGSRLPLLPRGYNHFAGGEKR